MSDFRPDIWRLQASFDIKGLIAALHNPEPGVRKRAAAALRALGAVNAISALKAALATESDTETRSNIVSALATLELGKDRSTGELKPDTQPDGGTVEALMRQLAAPQPEKVIAAALKLGELRDKRAVEPLIVLFNNSTIPVNVRLAIAEALLKLESAPVEVALLGALRSTKWRIRRNGAAILGQLRADWAVEPLIKAMTDEDESVRKTARAALKHINTPEARVALGLTEKTQSRRTSTLPRRPTSELPAVTDETAVTPLPTPVAVPAPAQPTVAPSPTPTTPPPAPQPVLWPTKTATAPSAADQSNIQTRPLDPRRLEELEARMKQDQLKHEQEKAKQQQQPPKPEN